MKKSENAQTGPSLESLFNESERYFAKLPSDLEDLALHPEKLQKLPVRVLYPLVRNGGVDTCAKLLPLMSEGQRKTMLDIDLWYKDIVDVDNFTYWTRVYDRCSSDELKFEFASSEQFLLFFKSRLTVKTFDVEDPQYPDHDYYFLTEDNLLLVEYDESFEEVDEVKSLIKKLYAKLGVEHAYSLLFKVLVDSFYLMQEDEFEFKKRRLEEHGFVDYMKALELTSSFGSLKSMQSYIRSKKSKVAESSFLASSSLYKSYDLSLYKKSFSEMDEELSKVKSHKRTDFLQYNFILLNNAYFELRNALKKGKIEATKGSQIVEDYIGLGYSYLVDFLEKNPSLKLVDLEESLFDKFDFIDFFRFGKSLLTLEARSLRKGLQNHHFQEEKDISFLGNYWEQFITSFSEDRPKLYSLESKKGTVINHASSFLQAKSEIIHLNKLLPFIKEFYEKFNELKKEDLVKSEYYRNYAVDDIDFESLMMSVFISYVLNQDKSQSPKKIGLSLDEYKNFLEKYYVNSQQKLIPFSDIRKEIELFSQNYGLSEVTNFGSYLYSILDEQISGVDYHELKDEEYEYVGGPILLV